MSQFYAPIQEISAGAILLLPLQSEKLLIGDKNESAENQLQTSEGNVMGDESFDRRKLIFPGLAGLYETFSPYSYSLMRFAAGALLVPHGIQKIMNGSWTTLAPYIEKQLGVPYPLGWAYLAIFAESVVAACLAIGLFTRLAALILVVYMGIIILFFQWQFGYFWTNRGIEYALLWWILYVAIFFRGGGRYSVDHYLNKHF